MDVHLGEWKRLGPSASSSRFYREVDLFELEWSSQINLDSHIVAVARAGGAIAMTRDTSKIVLTTGALRPSLDIFAQSGAQIASIDIGDDRIVSLGWTRDERLLAVLRDGTVKVYSASGRMLRTLTVSRALKELGVLTAAHWDDGVVVIDRALGLHVLRGDLDDARARQLPAITPEHLGISVDSGTAGSKGKGGADELDDLDDDLDESPLAVPAPLAVAVRPARSAPTSDVKVFLAFPGGVVLAVDSRGVQTSSIPGAERGQITSISTDPSGRFLAVWVATQVPSLSAASNPLSAPPTSAPATAAGAESDADLGSDLSDSDDALAPAPAAAPDATQAELGSDAIDSAAPVSGATTAAGNAGYPGHRGALIVVASELDQVFTKLDFALPPPVVSWIGSDSVLCGFRHTLKVVGPTGSTLDFPIPGVVSDFADEPVVATPEVDGVRVISNTRVAFLQCVPQATHDSLSLGSTLPPALLCEAVKDAAQHSARSDDHVRAIPADQMLSAVLTCVEAAGGETLPGTQKLLMAAAAHGKAFLPPCAGPSASAGTDPMRVATKAFTAMVAALRVRNHLQSDNRLAMAMTAAQMNWLGPSRLVLRCCGRLAHLVAFKLAKALGADPAPVLLHWAELKVRTSSLSDEQLRTAIVGRLAECPGTSLRVVATAALDVGRRELGTMLLDHEPRALDQVDLLLTMSRFDVALRKAAASGDSDLVFYVISSLRLHQSVADVAAALKAVPEAVPMFAAALQALDEDSDTVAALLGPALTLSGSGISVVSLPRAPDAVPFSRVAPFLLPSASTMLAPVVHAAYAQEQWDRCRAGFHTAAALVGQDAPASVSDPLFASLTGAHSELLAEQSRAEALVGQPLVGRPLVQTLEALLASGQARKAADLRASKGVSDSLWRAAQIRACAASGDWKGLEKLAAQSKSKDLLPYFTAARRADAHAEAAKYAARMSDPRDRAAAFLQLGSTRFQEAIDAASQLKDPAEVESLMRETRDRQALAALQKVLAQLG
jgi:hypothetical protein